MYSIIAMNRLKIHKKEAWIAKVLGRRPRLLEIRWGVSAIEQRSQAIAAILLSS